MLYQLQRMLGLSKNIPSLKVWDVSAPALTSRFEDRVRRAATRAGGAGIEDASGDVQVLECFHPISDRAALSKHSEMRAFISNMQEQGVAFPGDGSGVTFVHGDLPGENVEPAVNSPTSKSDVNSLEEDGIQALLICSVLVGRSFPAPAVENLNADNATTRNTNEDSSLEACKIAENIPPSNTITERGETGARPSIANSDGPKTPFELPDGYDSLCFLHNGKSPSSDSSSALAPYRAKFKTFDSAGVNPRFLVTFLKSEVSGADKELLCDNCCAVPADVYCRHEDANLCKGCDKELHNNKFLCKHKRVPLRCSNTQDDPAAAATESDSSLEIFKSKCPFHANMDVEFFCPECDVPVCIYCKMVGSHSQGEANNHRLIGVRVAWKQAIDEASEKDAKLLEINRDLRKQAGELRRLGQAVDLNESSMIQYIDDMAAKAREQVSAHASAKRKVLASDAFQIQRRAQELENLGSFLELQKTKLLPVEFITFWGVHKRIAAAIASHPVHRPMSLVEVVPDVSVTSTKISMQTTAPYRPYPHGDVATASGRSHEDARLQLSKTMRDSVRKGSRHAGALYSAMEESVGRESESDSFTDSDTFSDDDCDDENSTENDQRRNRRRLSMLSAKMRRKRRSTIVDAAEVMEL